MNILARVQSQVSGRAGGGRSLVLPGHRVVGTPLEKCEVLCLFEDGGFYFPVLFF